VGYLDSVAHFVKETIYIIVTYIINKMILGENNIKIQQEWSQFFVSPFLHKKMSKAQDDFTVRFEMKGTLYLKVKNI